MMKNLIKNNCRNRKSSKASYFITSVSLTDYLTFSSYSFSLGTFPYSCLEKCNLSFLCLHIPVIPIEAGSQT